MQDIIAKLTANDDKYACALADKIISESKETDEWYECFDDFAALLRHPKSLVRNRALHILAANAQWDDEDRFDAILPEFLSHITDKKPITARLRIKALSQVGLAKPQYIPRILRKRKRQWRSIPVRSAVVDRYWCLPDIPGRQAYPETRIRTLISIESVLKPK